MAQPCPDTKRSRIAHYLDEKTSEGKKYFKSKFIADEVDLSSKEVGKNMAKLADETDEFSIEKHSRSRSITWRVTRDPPAATATPQHAD